MVPFLYYVHEAPFDFYRYTEFCLQRLSELAGMDRRSDAVRRLSGRVAGPSEQGAGEGCSTRGVVHESRRLDPRRQPLPANAELVENVSTGLLHAREKR
jgi:hypothetical protein